MERISGPHDGYFIASYTVAGEDGVFAYAKICAGRPRDVWEAQALRKVGAGPFFTEQPALAAVELKARSRISVPAAGSAGRYPDRDRRT